MKTTYLLNKAQPDGSVCLSIATRGEWLTVVETNKFLPTDQRRYFIIDCIADCQDADRMVIETSAEEYRKWNKARMASARNRALGKSYYILSLDVPIRIGDIVLDLREALNSGERLEEQVCAEMLAVELKEALTAWKPWANDLLECYLRGDRRTCTGFLSEKYRVSPQVIRKYKRQFEAFVKNFFDGVSL